MHTCHKDVSSWYRSPQLVISSSPRATSRSSFPITPMAFLAGFNHIRSILSLSPRSNHTSNALRFLVAYPSCRTQWFSSSSTESTPYEVAGENAYTILRVLETSSFVEIKASFRKLAKETHPDLNPDSKNDSSTSQRFIQILAAYEILSDSERRAHYDMYLLSQRKLVEKHSKQGSMLYVYKSHLTTAKQMEVVEWLIWYRAAINDILSEKKVVVGSGYFDVLEGEFYEAIHAAYYGPVIESWDLLPDRFEAEERSEYGNPEVLHLVSGRDLFGMVCLVDKHPELSHVSNEKLSSFANVGYAICQYNENTSNFMNYDAANDTVHSQKQADYYKYHMSDAYKDLELHLSGKVIAVATRAPPKIDRDHLSDEDSQDHIHVFLNYEATMNNNQDFYEGAFSGGAVGSRIPLGKITGLGTNPEEGSCFVYNNSGIKTHEILKHRTLLVKHVHWYQLGDEVSICECRCSRARLPPSKFWLFEPRCNMHDIGGWYVETYGRDKKGRTIPSQRYWDGFEAYKEAEKRLHPAMYLLGLAYRTLDIEDAKRRKQIVGDIVGQSLFKILSWCKKLV